MNQRQVCESVILVLDYQSTDFKEARNSLYLRQEEGSHEMSRSWYNLSLSASYDSPVAQSMGGHGDNFSKKKA